ncbi:putative phosphorylase [Cladophialophora carrionii]|uniref:Putative phosphorylase n=1 Tax=Cladophialophora carrionii TaxID=86049 RepID=A0A1C1C9J8_9EURO|nr:putative phosphorylase [Cladophialophora carrionii]
MGGEGSEDQDQDTRSVGALSIPAGLEALCVTRFDQLTTTGQLIYEPSTAETVEDQGFMVNFRFAPHLRRKPITPADAPERTTGKGHNPFLNPPPSEVLSPIGPYHLLLVNKFSVYRPSLLLITREFSPQADGLSRNDLAAAWTILCHFKEPYMMIYNCGFESGSSQGHKHMQLWPYPNEQELGFKLFPSQAKSDVYVTEQISNVPHKHFVLRLPTNADLDTLVRTYDKLLRCVRQSHCEAGKGNDYNVIVVKEWMCMIPRRHSGLDRGAGANSAAMLGLVWIVTEAEREVWNSTGPTEYFKYLGLPQ